MSSDILRIIESILTDEASLGAKKAQELLDFLSNYRSNMWIYPGVLIRRFHMTAKEVYLVLDKIEKHGIIKSYYELQCGNCQRTNGKVRVFSELPLKYDCEYCGEEQDTIKNCVMIYLVVRDE